MTQPQWTQTTVDGRHGPLGHYQWGEAEAQVVAVPGVDGSGRGFATIAAGLAPAPVSALDLRGRGGADAEGPFGVTAHALDVAGVLERRDAPVVLVGHSFGGHVAARVAADRPELVAHLVLVDGGPPRVIPEELTARSLTELALGNILPNLAGKGFAVSEEAVRTDFLSMLADDASTGALAAVRRPVSLVRAGHGMAEGLPPVITDEVVETLTTAGVELTDLLVPAATHFSLLGDHAQPVIDTLRALV